MDSLGNVKNNILLCLLLIIISSCNNRHEFTEALPETVDFNFHIKPILVQNCYLCHGPDPSSRKANLRLDLYEGATAELEEGGYAIVPGAPSKSKLIFRINHEEEDQMMPPPESNYKLSPREKALLEKWIDQGAEWKPHWSFIKPETSISLKSTNTIDSLISQEIELRGLKKSEEAGKNSLIRRVSYLISGMPPTPDELRLFLNDESPDAYKKMVDHYLNSAAYGERWARHWMDLVRYAETKGHEFDYAITGAWKYRDYLIRAFNDDIPYDQIIKEHLAGDLQLKGRYGKSSGILESPLATAFYTMGEGTHSPVDIKKDEADRIDNMIDVTSKTFQGLTVSCARCHDHKFDPILTADYYALYGIMESTRFSPVAADFTVDNLSTLKEIEDVKKYLQEMIAEQWGDKETKLFANQKSAKSDDDLEKDYVLLGDFRHNDLNGWKSDGLAFGTKSTLGTPLINKAKNRLLGLDSGRVSSKFFGTGIYGALRSPNFIIDKDFIGIRARGRESTIRIIVDNFQLIQNPIYGNLQQGIQSTSWNNFKFNVAPWKGHKAYIEILPGGYKTHNYQLPDKAYIEAEYVFAYDGDWPDKLDEVTSTVIVQAANAAGNNWSLDEIDIINNALKNQRLPSAFPAFKVLLDSTQNLVNKLRDNTFFYGVNDGFGIDSPVFVRGNYQDPSKDVIPRGFLTALSTDIPAFETEGSGRLQLAEAILDEENPLTARVMVNRIWHHIFGKGIVETVDNFGAQGKLPSHPELLDFLTVKFQKEAWSVKNMIRLMVNSETFKRNTLKTEEMQLKDPTNIYLASFPVRRLEAEAIRDGILVASESLNDSLYGPPVPTYLTDFMQGRGRPSKSGPLDGEGRRSIYLEVRRNFLEPMMTTFDRPIPFSTFGKRNVTNVPSQSLIIMNDPFVAKQAERMARKLLEESQLTFKEKITWIYTRAFSRKPTPKELEEASVFIKMLESEGLNAQNPSDREILIWKSYCHSIFNLKEFIYLI